MIFGQGESGIDFGTADFVLYQLGLYGARERHGERFASRRTGSGHLFFNTRPGTPVACLRRLVERRIIMI